MPYKGSPATTHSTFLLIRSNCTLPFKWKKCGILQTGHSFTFRPNGELLCIYTCMNSLWNQLMSLINLYWLACVYKYILYIFFRTFLLNTACLSGKFYYNLKLIVIKKNSLRKAVFSRNVRNKMFLLYYSYIDFKYIYII